ncbi:ANTAR domain-containing protein [Nocardia farcinica]|uniref:ANTAR domain-containing protein n=1 Tax=Nocardia farcinica TaxID=37329 RepID=UPI0018940B3F|nr:ANTAR domain-containing protein [Nocardia farcinica]MBF6072689.1 ANTAR domain-containing protein [Nocardia farcinica]
MSEDVEGSDRADWPGWAEVLEGVRRSRGRVEQAKGALMLVYGLDSTAAEQLLRRHSRDRGLPTAVLADQFLHTVAALGGAAGPEHARFDHLLLTAHQRLPADTDCPDVLEQALALHADWTPPSCDRPTS